MLRNFFVHRRFTAVIVISAVFVFFCISFLLLVWTPKTNHPPQILSQTTTKASVGQLRSLRQTSTTSKSILQQTQSPKQTKQTKQSNIPTENFDIVIIGSELEGMFLARSAADEGLSVKVLEPKSFIGGETLQGEMFFLDAPKDDHQHLLMQGKIKSLFHDYFNGKARTLADFQHYYNQLTKDILIDSSIHIQSIQSTKGQDGKKSISSLTYQQKDQSIHKIKATYWVDNSDNAALLQALHEKRLPGLENFYHTKEQQFQATTMMMKFKDVNWTAFNHAFHQLSKSEKNKRYGYAYVNESFALGLNKITNQYKSTNSLVRLRGLNALNQGNGDVIVNALLIYHVDPSNPKSISETLSLGKENIPRILQLFQKQLPGWEKAEINGYPPYLYIREYQHYQTEYVLQLSDLLKGKMFWDNVSIAGYPIDIQGTLSNKVGIEMGRPDKYGMPLRSFMLKNYDNVILAGKNVGASALAYGSARIQANTALAAESIGVILGQIKGKKMLKQINKKDMVQLHQYLWKHDHIQLTGIKAKNKIAGWTADEITKLNEGKIYYPTYHWKKHVPTKAN